MTGFLTVRLTNLTGNVVNVWGLRIAGGGSIDITRSQFDSINERYPNGIASSLAGVVSVAV